MGDIRDFALPDVGEGLTEAEVLRWLVRPGDHVIVNQMLVEVETAKAAVELPSPFAGVVDALHADEGTVVPVGAAIISIRTEDAAEPGERQPVLVGYGVREGGAPTRRRRVSALPAEAPAEEIVDDSSDASADGAVDVSRTVVRAKPPVRKLARDRGIDLSTIVPSGPSGEITRDDVLAMPGRSPAAVPMVAPAPSTSRPGERVPVRGVQRAMADAMVQSAFTAPHVTEWVDLDMTRALQVLEGLRAHPSADGVRVTPMVLVAAALIRAARQHPMVNASWIEEPDGQHVALHTSVNLGIAADTPRGLLVPTIRDAEALGVIDLARALQSAIDTARAGRSTPADLTGGTITLTNVGVFGVDGGTPILTPGQVAILAMGRIVDRPWVVDGAVVARPVMQLSLSFDHRVVDGALGSRVLRSIVDFLADPALALMLDDC